MTSPRESFAILMYPSLNKGNPYHSDIRSSLESIEFIDQTGNLSCTNELKLFESTSIICCKVTVNLEPILGNKSFVHAPAATIIVSKLLVFSDIYKDTEPCLSSI